MSWWLGVIVASWAGGGDDDDDWDDRDWHDRDDWGDSDADSDSDTDSDADSDTDTDSDADTGTVPTGDTGGHADSDPPEPQSNVIDQEDRPPEEIAVAKAVGCGCATGRPAYGAVGLLALILGRRARL